MLSYTTDVWRYRYFWGSLVRMDIRSRYRGTWLGVGWSLLQPLAMAAVIGLVFHKLFHQPLESFIPRLITGLIFWTYLTGCTVQGCRSISGSENYMRQVPAPLAIYPLRTTLSAAFHLLIATFVILLGNALIVGWNVPASVPAFVLATPLLLLFGWSSSVLTGFAQAYFPDMNYLIEIGTRMLFYCTPIIYEPERLRAAGAGWILDINPVASLLEVYRMPMLGVGFPDISNYMVATGFVLVLTAMALLTLKNLERKVIFQL